MNRSTFQMIWYMNGSVFSKTRYMNGVDFEILARTPEPKLPQSYPSPTPTPSLGDLVGTRLTEDQEVAGLIPAGSATVCHGDWS